MGEYAKKALKTYRRWIDNPPTKRDQADQPTYFLEENPENRPDDVEPEDSPVMKP